MTTALMLLWLAQKPIEHKDMPISEFPQIVCPISMEEYLERFRWWARKEVRERQLIRNESKWDLKI